MPKKIIFHEPFDGSSYLSIYFPDNENKINWYYEANEKLHIFDEITIEYQNNENILLAIDILGSNIGCLLQIMQELLENKLELPNPIKVGKLGLFGNLDMNDVANDRFDGDIDFDSYRLFSDKFTKTWAYNVEGKMIIEISPNYPWHFVEPKPEEEYYTFEEFIKNYKPYAVIEISKETAQNWIDKLQVIYDQAQEEHKRRRAIIDAQENNESKLA